MISVFLSTISSVSVFYTHIRNLITVHRSNEHSKKRISYYYFQPVRGLCVKIVMKCIREIEAAVQSTSSCFAFKVCKGYSNSMYMADIISKIKFLVCSKFFWNGYKKKLPLNIMSKMRSKNVCEWNIKEDLCINKTFII